VLTDSCRFCPVEDHRWHSDWDWRNPFTAYNCTWGFHYPTQYPEAEPRCGDAMAPIVERSNSTTCPRQMLCEWHTQPDGRETGRLTHCNIEGYGGTEPYKAQMSESLAKMPGGRCPYPPLDRAGPGPGFDADGRWVGLGANGRDYWTGAPPQRRP